MTTRRARWALCIAAPLLARGVGCGEAPPKPPPLAPETPAPKDEDGDGIPDDGTDKCLKEKEDHLPPEPDDGCRSSDADADGIADDGHDHCLGEKEDGKPPEPQDGCPTTDADGDGVLGAADKCPAEPETKNDFQDDDGCPDTVPRVRVTKTEVKINDKILFDFASAKIKPESSDLIYDIAQVVHDNPQIEFIEVAGHADKVGTDAVNVLLTRQRAQAVLDALVKLGIDRRRMRAAGYGRFCPIDKAETEAAREKNRRVEFKILRVDGVETGVALGCEEAVAHGLKPQGVPKTAPARAELEQAKKEMPPRPTPPPGAPPAAQPPPPTPPPPAKGPAAKAPPGKPGAKGAPPKPAGKPAKPPPPKPGAKAPPKK